MTLLIPENDSMRLVSWTLVNDSLPPRNPNDDEDDEEVEDEEEDEDQDEEPPVIREPDEYHCTHAYC